MKPKKFLTFRIVSLAAGIVTLASPSAFAAPRTWNGGGANNNWSPAANWGGTAPVAGDTLTFAGTTRSSSTNNLAADTSFAGISFTNTTAGQSFTFVSGGNRLTLGGDISTSASSGAGISDAINLAMLLSANRTITTGDLHHLTVGGNITDGGSGYGLNKFGAGTLTLTGVNTFNGGLSIKAGTVVASTSASALGGATGTGAVTLGDTSGSANATLAVSGNLAYLNPITVAAGSSGTLTISGTAGTPTLNGGITLNNTLILSANTGVTFGVPSTSVISGTGGVVVNAAGTGVIAFGAANTFTGGFTLNSGIAKMGGDNVLGNGTISLNGGVLASNNSNTRAMSNNLVVGSNFTLGQVTGGTGNLTLSGTMNLGAATRTITVDNTTDTLSGVISNGGLTKAGTGTMILSGTNTYSGTTTVSAGKLVINGNQSAANGALNVDANATLGGSGTIGGRVNVSTAATISPGNSAGNLSLNNGLTLAGTYQWELGALSTASPGSNYDIITLTAGAADITGASFGLNLGAFTPSADPFWQTNQTWAGILNNTGAGSLTGAFTISTDQTSWVSLGSFSTTTPSGSNDVNLVWTAVPEPSSALVGIFLSASLLRRHRRA